MSVGSEFHTTDNRVPAAIPGFYMRTQCRLRSARNVFKQWEDDVTFTGYWESADLVKAVSDATGLPILVPTGIYREPWIPDWAYAASEDELFTLAMK